MSCSIYNDDSVVSNREGVGSSEWVQSGQLDSQKKAEELEEMNLNFLLASNGIIHMFTICHSYLLFCGPPGAHSKGNSVLKTKSKSSLSLYLLLFHSLVKMIQLNILQFFSG